MVWIPVEKIPESRSGSERKSKWDEVEKRLREQPGQAFVIDHKLTKGKASSMVQALKKYENVGAWARSHDLPDGVEPTAVFARYSDPDQP